MVDHGQAEVKGKPDPQEKTQYYPIPLSHLDYLTHIEVLSNTLIRLYFSIRLKNTDNLLNLDTYQIDGPSAITVTDVARYKQKKLDLTIAGLIAEELYELWVTEDIFDVNDNEVRVENPYNIFSNLYAAIISAIVNSPTEIDITFNTTMRNNADLTDPANYVITYAPATVPLSYTINFNSGTEIDVTFTRNMALVADLCTLANYSIAYAPDTTPLGYALSSVSISTITVVFTKVMRIDTVLLDPTNYTISFASGSVPLSYTIFASNPTELDVTFNKNMRIDTTLINPVKYSISLTSGSVPLTYTALAISPTQVEITFNKNMHIDTILIDPTKYVMTL